MEPTLFPATVIGSLPRPAWVLDLILDRKAGRISEEPPIFPRERSPLQW